MSADTDHDCAIAPDDRSDASLSWPAAMPVLSDELITLRPWRAADAAAVLEACQDPEIQQWMDVPVPFLAHHADEFVGDRAREQWSSRRGAPFAITTPADGQVLGSCELVSVDQTDLVAQVVCAVHPSARGRGIAQRAVRLLCDWALTDLGLARLEFYIEPTNAASRAVAERLGCQLEGILRSKSVRRGTRRDFALYALLG